MISSQFGAKQTQQSVVHVAGVHVNLEHPIILLRLAPESRVSPLHASSYRDWLGILGTVVLRLQRSVLGHRRRVRVLRLKNKDAGS